MQGINLRFLLVLTLISGCIENPQFQFQRIQAPVNLSVDCTGVPLSCTLSFDVNNIEAGFSGYGVFSAASRSELENTPADQLPGSPDFFCPKTGFRNANVISSGERNIKVIRIQGTADTGLDCHLESFALSGDCIAVRARVERTTEPWSAPVIAGIPGGTCN